jgi:hypothetical protein
MGTDSDCNACGLSEPNEWCGEARMDCPFGKPPRFLNVHVLWGRLVEQEKRITALERNSNATNAPAESTSAGRSD